MPLFGAKDDDLYKLDQSQIVYVLYTHKQNILYSVIKTLHLQPSCFQDLADKDVANFLHRFVRLLGIEPATPPTAT